MLIVDLLPCRLAFAGRFEIRERSISNTMSINSKKEFIDVARRCCEERAIHYSVLSHGLSSFRTSNLFEKNAYLA